MPGKKQPDILPPGYIFTTTAVYVPFFSGDWLSSTKVQAMSMAERETYLWLLIHQYNDRTCTLPYNIKALSGFHYVQSQCLNDIVLSNFVVESHRMWNAKLYSHKVHAETQKRKGERAAHARWNA